MSASDSEGVSAARRQKSLICFIKGSFRFDAIAPCAITRAALTVQLSVGRAVDRLQVLKPIIGPIPVAVMQGQRSCWTWVSCRYPYDEMLIGVPACIGQRMCAPNTYFDVAV